MAVDICNESALLSFNLAHCIYWEIVRCVYSSTECQYSSRTMTSLPPQDSFSCSTLEDNPTTQTMGRAFQRRFFPFSIATFRFRVQSLSCDTASDLGNGRSESPLLHCNRSRLDQGRHPQSIIPRILGISEEDYQTLSRYKSKQFQVVVIAYFSHVIFFKNTNF